MERRRTYRLGFALLGLAALALGALLWLQGGQERSRPADIEPPALASADTAAPAKAPPSSPESLAALTSRSAPWRYVPGELRFYRFDYAQRLGVEAGDGAAREASGLVLSGGFETVVSDATAARAHLRVRVLLDRVSGGGPLNGNNNKGADQLKVGLREPFFVTLDQDGLVEEVSLPEAMAPEAAVVARALLGHFQCVIPDDAGERWQTTERDPLGEYRADYTRAGDGGLTKTKLGYTKSAVTAFASPGRAREALAQLSVGGEATITLQAGRIKTLRFEEHIDDPELLERYRVASDTRGSWRLVQSGRAVEQIGSFEAARGGLRAARDVAEAVNAEAEARFSADWRRQRVGDATLAELLTEANATRDSKGDRRRAAIDASDRLQALFELHPESVAPARDAAEAGELNGSGMLATMAALSATHSQAAHEALTAIVGGLGPEWGSVREMGIAYLGLSEPASLGAVAALDALASDPSDPTRSTTTLAIGNQGKDLLERDPEAGRSVVERLLAQFRAAKTPEGKALALAAIGNTGHPVAVTLAKGVLTSPHQTIREAAAWAVRFVPGRDADGVLSWFLMKDGDPTVRGRAIEACGVRDARPLAPILDHVARSDPDVRVRRALLSVVVALAPQTPELLTVARTMADHDPDDELRRAAASALANLTAPTR